VKTDAARRNLLPAAILAPFCLFAAFLFLAPLSFSSETLQDWWWAGLHFWRLPVLRHAFELLVPFIPLMILIMPDDAFQGMLHRTEGMRRAVMDFARRPAFFFPALFLVLWIFRSTSLIFGDAVFYVTDLIPGQAFSERGLVITFDSIGATMFYSLGYRYAHLYFDIDVLTWYNVFGLGCLMVFLAWAWANRGKGRFLGSGLILLLLFTGNWSQSTLGAPEHYGQLLLASLAFGILAVEALRGREPTWKACLAYSLGAFFHLEIGWLLPALIYLIVRRWKEDPPATRQLALLSLVIPALLTGSLVYSMGFDLSFAAESNSAKGKIIPLIGPDHPYSGQHFQYRTFDPRHLAHILQELLLMGWPGVILLAGAGPRLDWRRVFRDPAAVFLFIFFGGALLLNLLWNPDLEFWRDQDLFSIAGLALCLLGAYLAFGPPGEGLGGGYRTRLFTAALLGGLAWRVPVILYHSVLALNYGNPQNFGAWWPFAVGG